MGCTKWFEPDEGSAAVRQSFGLSGSIAAGIRNAIGAFLEAFLGRTPSERFLDDLDDAFGAWTLAKEKQGYTNEAVVEIVGAAYGRYCVETLGMRWIRLTDADGTAVAIQGITKDFRGFPYHAISKRIPVGEYGFFKLIYISLQEAAGGDWRPTGAG